ncbi:MAG: alpha/beta fold hydrolase [Acidimicrobiales bacterium]
MSAPVVLVHGLATSSARTWGETGWLDLLADAGRVTAPIDLPGHGTASKPNDPAEFDDLEQQVASQFPAERVDAIGFSLGARILLTIAAEDSTRFERLVVAGVGRNLFEADEDRGRRIAAAIAGDADPADPEASHFSSLAAAPDVDRSSLAALMASRRPPLEPDTLAEIACPVLVVIGDQDFAGPADMLAGALPDSELRVLKGVDHFATPKSFEFLDAALDFLGASPV